MRSVAPFELFAHSAGFDSGLCHCQPTNHLDLNGVFWLQHFLSSAALKDFGIEILVIVSHDRSFLDAVVTDVIMFAEQKLTTFPGTVSEYFGRMSEREDHMSRLRDAKHKQEKKMQAFIASAQTSTSKKPGKAKFVDPKKQKAGACDAAIIAAGVVTVPVYCCGPAKEKKAKLARLGWYRSDGKQFALRVRTFLSRICCTHFMPCALLSFLAAAVAEEV
jgi:hypothetical protein